MSAELCPLKRCRGVLDYVSDAIGRLSPHCARCDRRRAGICRDCPAPVYGTVGKAVRCAAHARQARLEAGRRALLDDARRRRKYAKARKRARTQAARARKREQRRAWAKANPDRVKVHRRRYLLRQTPGYRAYQQRANADPERQAKKRAHALKRYYERHPTRPSPICAACGEPIPYTGKGAPPKYHAEHSPWKKQLKGYRAATAQETAA